MKSFNGRHFLAFLGDFDAVSHQKEPVVYPKDLGENLKDGLGPNMRKLIEF
jgi:hypothetical protein